MQSRGFTLVELMVTVAVLGILASIGVPGMTLLLAQSRVAAAANDLHLALQHARSTAATERQAITVCAGTSDACADSEDWSAGWQTRKGAAADVPYKTHTLEGVTVTSSTGALTYTSLGFLRVAAPQSISFSAHNEQAQRWLCITPQGKSSVRREPCA